MRTFFNTLCFIIILGLLVTFAVENNHPADITYYGFKLGCAVYLMVLIPFFAGVVCGNILDVVKRFRLKKEIKRLRNELEKLDQSDYQ